jgi:quercetin dioxygenase-like cupin family protein
VRSFPPPLLGKRLPPGHDAYVDGTERVEPILLAPPEHQNRKAGHSDPGQPESIETDMPCSLTGLALVGGAAAVARSEMTEIDRPASRLNQILAHLWEIPKEELVARVVLATINPRTIAAWHTHSVYLYISKRMLTMDIGGQERLRAAAGEAIAVPLNSPMWLSNESDEPVKFIVFQISPPKSEFLDQ